MTWSPRRGRLRRAIGLATLLAAVAMGIPAAAQDAETTRAAEKLFLEGREAIAAGEVSTACAKFEESIRLVKAPGTVFNLAQCEEQRGRLLEAIRRWKDGIALLPDGDDRVRPAEERVAALDAKVPELTVVVPRDLPKKAEIHVNDDLVLVSALSTPLRLNPGKYVVTLTAPEKTPAKAEVQLAEGDRRTVQLALDPEAQGNPRRTVGFIVGGVGLAGLAIGGLTGLIILVRDGNIDDACPGGECTRSGYDDVEANRSLIVVNWVAFGVGVVATGVGAYLVLTSGPATEPAPAPTAIGVTAVAGGAALSLRSRF